jgi:phosphatidylglycerophosphate synthase
VILLTAGYRSFPPSIYGKLTTTLQIILVFTVLAAAVFHHPVFLQARRLLVYVVAGFTVFSGFHYSVVVARRLSHESPKPS